MILVTNTHLKTIDDLIDYLKSCHNIRGLLTSEDYLCKYAIRRYPEAVAEILRNNITEPSKFDLNIINEITSINNPSDKQKLVLKLYGVRL